MAQTIWFVKKPCWMHSERPHDMKILIVGNSQVACIRIAHNLNPSIFAGAADVSFYCFPGGVGPSFAIENDCLTVVPGTTNKDYPPFSDSPETPHRPISSYDAIVVSALGNIGGGLSCQYDLMAQGVLHDYKPKGEGCKMTRLSKSCYRHIMNHVLERQPGFQFLTSLRKAYQGRIVVQPFPRVSAAFALNPEWCLNKFYHDGPGAWQFFSGLRDEFLESVCAAHSAELISHPDAALHDLHLTKSEFITNPDGVHPGTEYGKLVLKQILKCLK
jgi:hypothetical protein